MPRDQTLSVSGRAGRKPGMMARRIQAHQTTLGVPCRDVSLECRRAEGLAYFFLKSPAVIVESRLGSRCLRRAEFTTSGVRALIFSSRSAWNCIVLPT